MLLLLNAHHEDIPFTLPALGEGDMWRPLLDTDELPDLGEVIAARRTLSPRGGSLALLRRCVKEPKTEDVAQSEFVAPEVAAAVNVLQVDPPPKESAGGSTIAQSQ